PNEVAGAFGQCPCAADSTESLPLAPDGQGTRIGEQSSLVRAEERRERPELFEACAGGCFEGLIGQELQQDRAHTLEPSKQHELRRIGLAHGRMLTCQERNVWLRSRIYQLGS